MAQSVVKVTEAAASRMRALMASQGAEAEGIKLGITTKGCSGMAYTLDFARELSGNEEVVDEQGVRLFIDPSAVMYVIGTEVDFVEDKLGSMFVFRNPNEKARCGCGESFSV
ncbi:MAG: HesB/IscA family protein [Geminicoccaceae bacterium]